MQASLFLKFFKFGLAGCLGLLIDFSITWFLKERVHINKYNGCTIKNISVF
jgi:putative flippase GtrA